MKYRFLWLAKRLIHFSLFLLIFYNPKLSAAEYYISPNGSDANTGTIQLPWKTIGKANRTLQSGDVVYIRQGAYSEDINPVNSGTSTAKIQFKRYLSEEPVLTGPSSGDNIAVVGIGYPGTASGWNAKSYIVIDGLVIQPSYARYGVAIYGNSSTGNEIRNCRLINTIGGVRDGILIGSGKHTLIENNTIDGNWRLGIITTQAPKYIIVRGNTIQNMQNSCIDIQTSYGVNQAFLIENNIINNAKKEDGIQFEHDYTKTFDPGTKRGVIIRNNTISNNAENSIDLKGAANVVIENNVIFGNRGDNDGIGNISGETGGIMKGGITFCQAHDILIRNNFIYDNFGGVNISNYGWTIVHNTIIGNNKTFWGSNISEADIMATANDDARRSPKLCGVILTETAALNLKYCAVKNNIIGDHHQGEIALITTKDLSSTDINNNMYFNSDGIVMVDVTANWNWKKNEFIVFKNKLLTIPNLLGKEVQSFAVNNAGLKLANTVPIGNGPFDYSLETNSSAIDKGDFLTHAVGSGSGRNLKVANSRYFMDGYEIMDGDVIKFASNGQIAKIVSVIDSVNIMIDRDVTWTDGDGISLFYYGSSPDIGAFEYIPQYFPHNDTPEPAKYLFAEIIAKQERKSGNKVVSVQLNTNLDVIQIPAPFKLNENDGSYKVIQLTGNVPGKTFSGIINIDETVSEGLAVFQLAENSLVHSDNTKGSDILTGKNILIDKTPPIVPMQFKILVLNK